MSSSRSLALLVAILWAANGIAAGAGELRTDCYGDPLPRGGIARLGGVRFRLVAHSLAFSPDGKIIASSSRGRLTLSDRATGRRIAEHEIDHFITSVIGFTTEGRVFVIGIEFDNTGVKGYPVTLLWPGSNRKPKRFSLDGFSPRTIAVSSDGKRFLVANEKAVSVWDVATAKKIGGHNKSPITENEQARYGSSRAELDSFALSTDGRLAAYTEFDSDVLSLVNVRTGETIHRFKCLSRGYKHLAFQADGKVLISANNEGVRFWDVNTAKELRHLGDGEHQYSSHSWFSALAISPDGKMLATAESNEKAIVVWDVATGQRTWPVGLERGRLAALRYAGPNTVVTLTDRGVVCFWDAQNGKCRRRLTPGQEFGEILAISSKADLLAGVARSNRTGVHPIGIWDTTTEKLRWQVNAAVFDVMAAAFSPDGKKLAVVARTREDSRVVCWDTEKGKAISSLPVAPADNNLWFSADSKLLAVGSRGEVRLFSVRPDGKWRALRGPIPLPQGAAHGLSPDGRMLLVRLEAWPVENGITSRGGRRANRLGLVETVSGGFAGWLRSGTEEVDTSVVEGAFSPDSKTVVATYDDGSVRLWDVATRREVERFPAGAGANPWFHARARDRQRMTVSPDGQSVAVEQEDRTVIVWPTHPPLDCESSWLDLAGADAGMAQRIMAKLTASPRQSVPCLERRLPPVPRGDERRLRQWIAELDSETYSVRQAAYRKLEEEGEGVADVLEKVLASKPSLEMRRRVGELLDKLEEGRRDDTPDDRRTIRAVQILESIDTPEARRVLKKLSGGASGALRTREARAALRRLEKTGQN